MFLPVCCLAFPSGLRAQSAAADSASYDAGIRAAVQSYQAFNQNQSRLYNGIQYLSYSFPVTGFPFLNTDQWSSGSVSYDREEFSPVPLLYDLVRDEVVVMGMDSGARIVLRPDLVSWFRMQGHTFIRVSGDTGVGLPDGYYDQLYSGPHELLAHRSKTMQESISGTTLTRTFQSSVHYYVRMGNTFHSINGKGALLSLFKDKKPAIQAYLRENHIRYHRDPELALAKMAAFYDLSNP
ncbi:MAG TPA: hypothetical protein VMV20_04910 [Chitinophagaceae bacterium]|nr:hypothetical protein [Chitinophagaceae bacterium]